MAKLRIVCYYRKSNEDDGSSIEQQRVWGKAAAKAEGAEILMEFPDQAKKGWDTNRRTAFHEMLSFCQEQRRQGTPVDAIFCWHPNRFSRSDSLETARFLCEFREAGVYRMFTALHGWRDFRRMEDRLIFNLEQDTTNHRFVLDLAQAATRGRIEAAKEGRPLAERPYGYEKEYEEVTDKGKKRRRPKRLVPGDPGEIEVVRWLFKTYATTITSPRRLAKELNRRGSKPPKRARGWTGQTIEAILKNPVYLGLPTWGRKQFGEFVRVTDGQPVAATTSRVVATDRSQWIVSENRHEALVDQKTFDAVQRRFAENRTNRSPRAEKAKPLAGLLRCGSCGAAMVSRDRKYRSGRDGSLVVISQYGCSGYNTYGTKVCGQNTVWENDLLDVLLKKFQDRFLDPALRKRLRDSVARIKQQERESQDGGAEDLRARVKTLADQIKNAARRMLTEDESLLPVLREQLREMQAEHDRLRQDLAALESRGRVEPWGEFEEQIDRITALVDRLVELRRIADPAPLRDLLNEMIERVELFFDHAQVGGKKRSQFVRGLIHPRMPGSSSHTHCSR